MSIPIDQVISSIFQGAMIGSIYVVLGLGFTVIFGVVGVAHVSYGDFVVLASFLVWSLNVSLLLDPFVAAALTLPIFAFLGFAQYYLFKRFLGGGENTNAGLIVSFAMIDILENVMQGFGTQSAYAAVSAVKLPYFSLVRIGVISTSTIWLTIFGLNMAIVVVIYTLLTRSRLGKSIRAVSDDPSAAATLGIGVQRMRITAFVIACLLMVLSGVSWVILFVATPYTGLSITIFGFVVAILGGVNSVKGTAVAGILVGEAYAIGSLFYGPVVGSTMPFLLFLAILVLRPSGLFGSKFLRR